MFLLLLLLLLRLVLFLVLFSRGVIFPTYGLAEHTVYVCSNGKDRLVVDRVMLETERKVSTADVQDFFAS